MLQLPDDGLGVIAEQQMAQLQGHPRWLSSRPGKDGPAAREGLRAAQQVAVALEAWAGCRRWEVGLCGRVPQAAAWRMPSAQGEVSRRPDA